MLKKINQETLIKFGFFVIIWLFIIFFTFIFNSALGFGNYGITLFNIFQIIFLFPLYIKSIIQNFDKLNLIDANYFWGGLNLGTNILWIVLFGLFACLYFSFVMTLLCGDNEKIKKILLKFHFGFFTIALILKAVHIYLQNPQDPNINIIIGSKNLVPFLSDLIVIATNIYILTCIKKEVDFKFLKNTIKKYFFIISELLLTLFVALTFYNYLRAPDASIIDHISYLSEFLLYGFFIFLLIQLLRIRFKEEQ